MDIIKSKIRGIVIDEEGNPLEGVEISLDQNYLKNPRYVRHYTDPIMQEEPPIARECMKFA